MSVPAHLTRLIDTSLPAVRSWAARPTSDDLLPLPNCAAVLLFIDTADRPVQLLTTQQLKRLVISRLSAPAEPSRRRADLAEIVRGVRWRQVHSAFEGRWWYYRLARVIHEREYRKLVSFGPAWFLHVDWTQRVPELHVTERVWCEVGQFIGPWPTQRGCQQALEGLWDLFDLCRYPEQVRRAPRGIPCAYADMGRCDAPCDGSAPLERYVGRCRAAWAFADGGAPAWVEAATERMKHAAAEQRYELAGQLKRQLAFADTWRQRWLPTVHPATQLNYLLAVPATRRKAWKLFLFRQGYLADGPLLPDRKLAHETPIWLANELQKAPVELEDVVRMEQTWLLAHFLHHKEGRAAIVEHLPDSALPPDLEGSLRDALAQRREDKQAP